MPTDSQDEDDGRRMNLNHRERTATRSLARLGRDRFRAFIAAAVASPACLAVKVMHDHLSAGHDLDSVFVTGERHGFTLQVEAIDDDRYQVDFGCVAGGLAGDGGSWHVEFDGLTVVRLEPGTFWIS
jgi:hypothetical protein